MREQVRTISFIGSGNVATHLALAFKAAGFDITEVFSPTYDHADTLAKKVNATAIRNLTELNPEVDLYLLAVPDGSIEEVVRQFRKVEGIVAHTSGINPLDVLKSIPNRGVLYPLQTFSKRRELDISEVPFCIEASSKKIVDQLRSVAMKLSCHVCEISSEQRQYLHLAAVFANNYSNYLYQVAFDLLEKEGVDHSLLMPLIIETVSKINTLHPKDAQTGPARRNDQTTINKHIQLLRNHAEYKELYQILAGQLKKTYNE